MGFKHPVGSPKRSHWANEVKVYTSSGCRKCAMLKEWLRGMNIEFDERNLEDAEVMTDLIMRNVFILSAPALEVGGEFYRADQIFNEDKLVVGKLLEMQTRGK